MLVLEKALLYVMINLDYLLKPLKWKESVYWVLFERGYRKTFGIKDDNEGAEILWK